MKNIFKILMAVILLNGVFSCRSTKKLQAAVNTKDTSVIIHTSSSSPDSLKAAKTVLANMGNNHIDFKTFSAKIKVEYEDSKGKKPDVTANIKIQKDSVIWISIVGNVLFISGEAFRVLITKNHITIINRLDKVVEERPFSFIKDMAKIPLDFKTLQDLIIGNPIYVGDKLVSYRVTENHILLSTAGKYFKNLLTLSVANNNLIERSKLDDIDVMQNRTGDLTYGEYEHKAGFFFSTYREITVAEKTKVDIRLNFKQYEFNTELSTPFNIPKNYKTK
ncbi:MAG: DUF4292 domain-containing protein [Bacteroidota bacterium]|nr:DUF4292 domain-containing protein [Bacteroidota bacterium]